MFFDFLKTGFLQKSFETIIYKKMFWIAKIVIEFQ